MHVLFVGTRAPLTPERRGAIEKLTFDLASTLVAEGHDATVLTVGESGRRYTAEGVQLVEITEPITRPPSHVTPVVEFGRKARRVADRIHRENPVDVVHAVYYPNLLGFRPPGDAPLVVAEHNAHPWRKEHRFIEELTITHRLRWEADTYIRLAEAHAAFFSAERVLSVSDAHGEWIDRAIPEARSKRETMYNFVDTDVYRPDAASERGIDFPDGKTVLYAGRKVPHKGLHRAVSAISKMETDTTLVILGPLGSGFSDVDSLDGVNPDDLEPYLGSVIKNAQNSGVTDQISFPGYVADADLPAYYAAADVTTFPSVLESFGMVPVESMACGTPVVAHDVPPIDETVLDGETGLLTNEVSASALAAALDRLLTDDSLRSQFAEQGRNRAVEQFDIETAVQEHIRLYERVRSE
ncbi:glycosyltransferase family 4 protein [Halogeometricum borinquense]|uniref:glycosyltransferase family 4 protein n=1 Tax=Halogeometricum borinquense TaxID=60847 RepID=UPI003420915C